MTVADYVLAALALIGSLALAIISFLVASIDQFAPVPNEQTGRTARKGCLALIVALAAVVYFAGVLLAGRWGWMT